MTKEEFIALYQTRILGESNAPYHFEKRGGDSAIRAYNPMCGDKYFLYPTHGDGMIEAMHFHGIGCAVSMASSSILARLMEGKSDHEALELVARFLRAVESNSTDPDMEEDLALLVEIKNFDGRLDCLTLSWRAMQRYLKQKLDED